MGNNTIVLQGLNALGFAHQRCLYQNTLLIPACIIFGASIDFLSAYLDKEFCNFYLESFARHLIASFTNAINHKVYSL